MYQLGAALKSADPQRYQRVWEKVARTTPNREYEVFVAMLAECKNKPGVCEGAVRKMLDSDEVRASMEKAASGCICWSCVMARWVGLIP